MTGVIRSLFVGFGLMFVIAPCAFMYFSVLSVMLACACFIAWLIASVAVELFKAASKAASNGADHSLQQSLVSYPSGALTKEQNGALEQEDLSSIILIMRIDGVGLSGAPTAPPMIDITPHAQPQLAIAAPDLRTLPSAREAKNVSSGSRVLKPMAKTFGRRAPQCA